jgi:hypothetical protein
VHERDALKRYLDQLEAADSKEEVVIDHSAVAAALAKLGQHPEPEAHFMRSKDGKAPAYNVQTAVDAEHALIVVQQVTLQAIPTENRPKLVRPAASLPTRQPTAASTAKAMARYSTAPSSPIIPTPTHFCVRPVRRSHANNCTEKIVP